MKIPNIFRLGRKDREILDRVTSYIDLIVEASFFFYRFTLKIAELDFEAAARLSLEVERLETEADTVHRGLVGQLSEGIFFAGMGEDLLNMLEKIDAIADNAKDASRVMSQISFNHDLLRYFFQSGVIQYVRTCLDAAEALRRLISSLDQGRERILEQVKAVEELEEEADSLKAEIQRHLMNVHTKYNAVEILELENFLNFIDNMADNAEDASDVVLVMIAKGYG
ncbi:MAG: DUF47 family protein [Candidatus Bathyarchaeia archaeon]